MGELGNGGWGLCGHQPITPPSRLSLLPWPCPRGWSGRTWTELLLSGFGGGGLACGSAGGR